MAEKKKKIEFNGYSVTIGDDKPQFSLFKDKIQAKKYAERLSNTNFTFTVEYKEIEDFKEAFMFIYIEYGQPFPRSPNYVHQVTQKTRKNPRTADEYEPKQDFIVIDFKRSSAWLCHVSRRNLLKQFLRSFGFEKIGITEVYNEAEFIKSLKKLNDLRVSAAPELFSAGNTLSKELVNEMNGYGAPRATIHFHYSYAKIGDKIKSKIKGLLNQKDSFKSIRISGRNNQNIGMVFNSEIFSKKIQTDTVVDENERFTPTKVFADIIRRIRNEKD